MIKKVGLGWSLRTTVIAGACAMALAGAAGTAAASEAHPGIVPHNSSPNLYGPNTATLNWFCGRTDLWKAGATFDGTNNGGGRDEWVVELVTDSPQDTKFQGLNDLSQLVTWYCG